MPDCIVKNESYFIGGNTKNGFVGYGDEIFAPYERMYIIKGGPGTGKSTFMKKVCALAEEKGYPAVKYHCSSDPTSLDAVCIDGLSLCITDGTAPHAYDGKYMGCRDNILNFGMFWNTDFLKSCFHIIKEIDTEKKNAYNALYRLLHGMSEANREKLTLLKECYLNDKAFKAVLRIMSNYESGECFSVSHRQITSLGMRGRVSLNTYKALAEHKWYIYDKRGISPLVFETFLSVSRLMNLKTYVSHDTSLNIDGMYFPDIKLSLTLSEEDEGAEIGSKTINTERFIGHGEYVNNRGKIRFLSSLEQSIMPMCLKECDRIKNAHFALEDIYSQSMDYMSLNDYTERIIKEMKI